MAVTGKKIADLVAEGKVSATSDYLFGDALGVSVAAFGPAHDGFGFMPPSLATAGHAITNNYAGYGEVDFWNLVNNEDTNNEGFYFHQKTGAGTSTNIAALYASSTRNQFDVSLPSELASASLIAHVSGGLGVGTTQNEAFSIITNGVGRVSISAAGAVSVLGSLLQNKAVATPLTGTTVTMTADRRYQAIAPAGTIAALTLVLPPSPVDNQACSIGSSQIITALTVNAGTGAAARVGAPTTMAAGSGFTMVYQSSNNTWYRAG